MREKISLLSKNRFVQGGFIFIASNIVVSAINYLFNVLAAKTLGPAGYGEISALFSYLAIGGVPMAVVSALVIKRIGIVKNNKYAFIASLEKWFFKKIKKWWWLYSLLILSIPLTSVITNLKLSSVIALFLLIPITVFGSFFNALIMGVQMFFIGSLIGIIGPASKLIGIIAVADFINIYEVLLAFIVVGGIIGAFSAHWVIQKKVKKQKKARVSVFEKRILSIVKNKTVITTTLSLLSIAVLTNIDVMVAKKVLDSTQAGLYSAWSLFAKSIMYAVGPIIGIAFIFFTDAKKSKHHNRGLAITILIILFASACAYLFYSFIGKFLVLLLFNKQYLSILPLLPYAAVFGACFAVISMVNNFFIAQNSKWIWSTITTVPIYTAFLILFGKTFSKIVMINIIYGASLTLIFISYTALLYIKTIKNP